MRDMKTNFVGPMNVTNAILPHMRMKREGTIVFIGSRSVYRPQMLVSTFLPCIPSLRVSTSWLYRDWVGATP
jgi:short-subunit dehydrogenase involved in D-alanine esterification of teichoic acids